jgi:DHA1 family inner membrane transport protein
LKNFPVPLIALALSAFAIGTTEFVIMGLLPQVAGSLAVSIPSAGWLVSGYALGVFIGAPIMAIATQKLPHRSALMLLMAVFVVGNVLCALAPSYDFLMVARIVTALCHGAFFGIGAVEAASLVPENRRAQAVALMFTGLTLANVLGVPLGTALGQVAGWRMTFWAVAALGLLSLAGLYLLLPRQAQKTAHPNMLREFAALKAPVWLALAITVAFSASMFAMFTYIAPVLNDVTHVSPRGVTYTLFLIGVGLTLGNILGGRMADWRVTATLAFVFVGMAVVLGLLTVTARHLIPAEVTLFIWAVCAFAGVPALQINVVNFGSAAPNLISTLNIAAFNAGNALGAWAGGVVIADHFGFDAIPPTAAMISVAALLLTFLSRFVQPKRTLSHANSV